MFSKRMGLVLTYNNNNNNKNKNISSLSKSNPTPVYTRMNRILNSNINNGTMSSIIHQPPGSCSSCGN